MRTSVLAGPVPWNRGVEVPVALTGDIFNIRMMADDMEDKELVWAAQVAGYQRWRVKMRKSNAQIVSRVEVCPIHRDGSRDVAEVCRGQSPSDGGSASGIR